MFCNFAIANFTIIHAQWWCVRGTWYLCTCTHNWTSFQIKKISNFFEFCTILFSRVLISPIQSFNIQTSTLPNPILPKAPTTFRTLPSSQINRADSSDALPIATPSRTHRMALGTEHVKLPGERTKRHREKPRGAKRHRETERH